MKVTYLGTTVLLFDDGKDCILFDAHITRPSIFKLLLSNIETNTKLADELIEEYQMKRVKHIFISHSHHDHVMDMPYFASQSNAHVYGSSSTLNVARGGNIQENHLHLFDLDHPVIIGDFKITILPSIHSKAKWYNNDLGQQIIKPLKQPAKKKEYKEGGSYDFYIEHQDKTYLIRPSYNYLEGELNEIKADIVFFGVGGLANDDDHHRELVFQNTLEMVEPKLVIPVHWDNFFKDIRSKDLEMPIFMESTKKVMALFTAYCKARQIEYIIQQPLTTIEI